MSGQGDASLVARWRQGDQDAAAELFRRYAHRLVSLVRGQLSARLNPRFDADDVVQSVYRSFFGDVREGRYDIGRGGDLWRLLVTITLHKLQHQVQRHQRARRAVGREQAIGSADGALGIQADILARGPSPAEAVTLADELEHIFRGLEPLQRRMLELRLQGYNLDEIAAATERSERTVRRVLERLKLQLEQHSANAHP